MLIASAVVFCLALYFSFMFVALLCKFVASATVSGHGKMDSIAMMVPALLWSVFYLLVRW